MPGRCNGRVSDCGWLWLAGWVIVTAVGGWWYLFNGLVSGDPLALESHNALPPVDNIVERLGFSLAQSWGAFKSYWAAFGWATIFCGTNLVCLVCYPDYFGSDGVAVAETAVFIQHSATKVTQILWLAVLLNGGLMVVWLWRTAAPYGRLLFPVIAPLSCLLALGWQRWLARRHWPGAVGQVMLTVPLLGLALFAPGRELQPAFAPVVTDAITDYLPLKATFGEQFHLLGYSIEPETMQVGDAVTLTLFWQLAQPADGSGLISAVVQVAPIDPEMQVTAVSELLGTSRYPTPFWQMGEIIVQQHTLTLAEGIPAPSLYWFDVILLDEATQTRLPIVWQAESLADSLLRIGPEPIFSEETAVPIPATRTDYTFGQQIQLDGYEIHPAESEAGLVLTLHWQALAQPTTDWTVFIHLVDESGDLIAQGDSVPRDGNFPTLWWTAGTTIPDTHLLAGQISCDELSQYRLLLGFYNPATNERLPVSDAFGQPLPNNALEIQPTCSEGSS